MSSDKKNNGRVLLDLSKLPSDRFEARRSLFEPTLARVMEETVSYINSDYPKKKLLDEAMCFVFQDMFDCPKSDIDSLSRCGFFPWVESQNEIDSGINLLIFGFYKNVYDSLRRALELILVGAYFTSECTNSEMASKWMNSKNGTPYLSQILKELPKTPIFSEMQDELDFKELFQKRYWALCDVVHTKGVRFSNQEINKGNNCINGIMLTRFDKEACSGLLDEIIEVIGLIAIVVAASNPILLLGFNIDQKFGINGPCSGFFYPSQTETLFSLMPQKYQNFFKEIAKNDESLKGVKEWFDGLPDITEEQFEKQCKQHDLWLGQINNNK